MKINNDDVILIMNRVTKLYEYMKQKFGDVFEDVDLQFTFNKKMTPTCVEYSRLHDDATIYFNTDELSDILNKQGFGDYEETLYNQEALKDIDNYFSYYELAFLHELGHYLDALTAEQTDLDFREQEQNNIWNYLVLQSGVGGLTEPELGNCYRQLPMEEVADVYAVEMAVTISKEIDDFYAFDDYNHLDKPKTLQERLAETMGDY